MTTPVGSLPDGLKPREQDPQAKVARQLEAIAISLHSTINLVNRLDTISKDALAVSDDLLNWVMAYKERLAVLPGCMEALMAFSNRLLDIRERELSAYEDMLEVLGAQAPKMRLE
jgi:hypothetical protein